MAGLGGGGPPTHCPGRRPHRLPTHPARLLQEQRGWDQLLSPARLGPLLPLAGGGGVQVEGTLWSLETRRRCFQSQFRFHHVVFKTWAADGAPHPHGVLLVLEGCGQRGLEWGGV